MFFFHSRNYATFINCKHHISHHSSLTNNDFNKILRLQNNFKTNRRKTSTMCVVREFAIILILLGSCRMEFENKGNSPGINETEFETINISPEIVRYEPLYVVEKYGRFAVVDSMTFDEETKKYVLLAPKKFHIELACPSKRHEDGVILETVGQPITNSFPLGVMCDNPVKPFIEKFPDSNFYSVGFLMYKEDADFTRMNLNQNLPPTHNPITLMVVNFDKTDSRPASVWHTIFFGKYIQIESSEPVNNLEYEKNDDIFDFNIDEAYNSENQRDIFASTYHQPLPCPLLKIQLAPAEDFFLTNFKKLTRININTAPIWERVLPQWRSLEEFVRKVARVLGKLTIITGTSNFLIFPTPRGGAEALHLYKKYGLVEKLPVPKYFWKAIISYHGLRIDPELSYGIIFIMLNDPFFGIRKREYPHLCHNIIEDTGWDRFAETIDIPSEIYACRLTQDIMDEVQGGVLPIPEYNILNLNKTLRSYLNDMGDKETEIINVMEGLKRNGLL